MSKQERDGPASSGRRLWPSMLAAYLEKFILDPAETLILSAILPAMENRIAGRLIIMEG
jgi:hypothetical protein